MTDRLWRFVADLVLPPRWTTRAWPYPGVLPEYLQLLMREALVDFRRQLVEQIYAPNPLFDRLTRGSE